MSMMTRAWQNTYNFFAGHRQDSARLILLGLDSAGKSTFLYKVAKQSSRMFPAEVVTTIPTIGFNVETMEMKSLNFTCWDVGGCDKIRPLWRHFMQNVEALIFFIDGKDRDRVPEAKTELELFLREVELQGRPLLVVANKCDIPEAMNTQEVTDKLNLNAIQDRDWHILSASVCDGTGVPEILDWMESALRKGKRELSTTAPSTTTTAEGGAQSNPASAGTTGPTQANVPLDLASVLSAAPPVTRTIMEHWVEREDEPESDFLTKLENFQLDIWDHYTHVRIAWVLIKKHGIKDGFTLVEGALRAFIENSARTDSRSFHATMTRFWCHMIVYCMELAVWEGKTQQTGDFKAFIGAICAPNSAIGQHAPLWDKALFKRYYSSHAMFKAEARAEASPPDLQALPDIVAIMTAPAEGGSDVFNRDVSFLESSVYWKLTSV